MTYQVGIFKKKNIRKGFLKSGVEQRFKETFMLGLKADGTHPFIAVETIIEYENNFNYGESENLLRVFRGKHYTMRRFAISLEGYFQNHEFLIDQLSELEKLANP